MATNGEGAPGSGIVAGRDQAREEREREPLSRNAFILRLIFGVFLLLWWAVRWLVTVGGLLGGVGVGFVFVVPVLLVVLFGGQDWFVRDGGNDNAETLTTLGTILLFGFIVGGIVLWIVGIVRKREGRSHRAP